MPPSPVSGSASHMSDRDHKHPLCLRTVDDGIRKTPQEVPLGVLIHLRLLLWTQGDCMHGAINLAHESLPGALA